MIKIEWDQKRISDIEQLAEDSRYLRQLVDQPGWKVFTKEVVATTDTLLQEMQKEKAPDRLALLAKEFAVLTAIPGQPMRMAHKLEAVHAQVTQRNQKAK